jgi:hypothetical protein
MLLLSAWAIAIRPWQRGKPSSANPDQFEQKVMRTAELSNAHQLATPPACANPASAGLTGLHNRAYFREDSRIAVAGPADVGCPC